MTELRAVARRIRSKNAGPFWITIDVFCDSPDVLARVAAGLPAERVADYLQLDASQLKRVEMPNITAISHATIQGTYQMPFEVEEGQDGGALYDADPRLREAVSECCSVRLASAGVVTKMVRAKRAGDLQRAKRIKKESQERLKEEERQKARARLQKLNATASVTPVETVDDLAIRLESFKVRGKL